MMKKGLLLLSFAMSAKGFAQSAPASGTTQDLLIQKLTQVQIGLAPSDPARGSVLLRLADLHAERARQLSMKELEDECIVCKAGEKDREKALSYYSEALTKVPVQLAPKVHLQMGHLFELQGRGDQAKKSYQAMLTTQANPIDSAEAYLSLAEMAFRQSDFKTAQDYYAKVLATEGASSQGLAAYRKAWCAYRLNDNEGALKLLQEILRNPKLQSRMANARGVADVQFLEEVSRDMATFMAARGLRVGDSDLLYSLAPENFKIQQVTLLAREAIRLGQKEPALHAWEFVYQKQSDPKARLEAQIRLAQIHFDLKNMSSASHSFEMALGLWSGSDCSVASCDESGKSIRQFIVSWNRLENTKPSNELLSAYESYLKVFSKDEDMYVWGAQAAAQAGQFVQAAGWTASANELILVKLSQETDVAQKKSLAEKLEKNLLLGIENAEKSKDEKILAQAQDQYLAKTTLKSKIFDVQYQKTYAIYHQGEYQRAAQLLRDLAVSDSGVRAVQIQAADLSLDALALLKDDQKIEEYAAEYAAKFSEKRPEFQKIQQKAILTRSAHLAASQPSEALSVLAGMNLQAAGPEDRKACIKNRILLNEKLNKITEARAAIEDLLRESNLTPDEKEFALGRKVWFAELELDFATALKTAEQMKFQGLSSDEKLMKLAMYADLANLTPAVYYNQFLKQSSDNDKKALIAAQLIKKSQNPVKDLEAYKIYFKTNPGLFARVTLDVYGRIQDRKLLDRALLEKGAEKQDAYLLIQRIVAIEEIRAMNKQVANHNIDIKNQRSIALGLKERVKLLEKIDALANKAIASADWSAQLLALDMVARENIRFYNEALALPMPAGLTPEQENEYLMLLSQQVAPNQSKSQIAQAKVKEFWAQGNTLESFKSLATQNPQWSVFIADEMAAIAEVSSEESKARWLTAVAETQLIGKTQERPTLAEIQTARSNLRINPFAAQAIQSVIEVEKRAHNESMVDYLQGRLVNLSKKEIEVKEKTQ